MWLFTRYGFFSTSVNPKKPEQIYVRARNRQHLVNLQKRFNLDGIIITTPYRDYGWRIVVGKSEWAFVMSHLVKEQDWANFKDEVHEQVRAGVVDAAYSDSLMQVWRITFRLQERGRR